MAENSNIEWTDHTFNPWVGCTKVSPGCKNCYAETLMDKRYGRVQWGVNGTRSRTSAANWKLPLRWNREAEHKPFVCNVCGVRSTGLGRADECEHIASGAPVLVQQRPRVFCASLADVFEDRPELVHWRADLFSLIDATPNLDWLLLTKRPENIGRLWVGSEPTLHRFAEERLKVRTNVWLGTSVEDQSAANERIPHLLKAAHLARFTFLSCEPLLGMVDITKCVGEPEDWHWDEVDSHDDGARPDDVIEQNELEGDYVNFDNRLVPNPEHREWVSARRRWARLYKLRDSIDWVICGGESGHGARPMHPDWARSLRDQCKAAGVPFLFKQWGEYAPAIAHLRTDERYVNEVRWLTNMKLVAFKPYRNPDRVNFTNLGALPHSFSDGDIMAYRVGKKAAGRLLDGVEHNAFPA